MKQLLFAVFVCIALPVPLVAESNLEHPQRMRQEELLPAPAQKQCIECAEVLLKRVSDYQASLSTYGVTLVEMKDHTGGHPTIIRGGFSGLSRPVGGVEVLVRW